MILPRSVQVVRTAPGCRRLQLSELSDLPLGFVVEDLGERYFVFNLPDKVTSLVPLAGMETSAISEPEVILYGPHQPGNFASFTTTTPTLLSLGGEMFFLQALLPLTQNQKIVFWVQVSPLTVVSFFRAFNFTRQKELKTTSWHGSCYGICSNLLPLKERCGLFSVLSLTLQTNSLPKVEGIEETGSPFTGLQTLAKRGTAAEAIDTLREISAVDHSLAASLEETLTNSDTACAESLLNEEPARSSSRIQFLAGMLFEQAEDFPLALRYYHQAQLLDHISGVKAEQHCLNQIARPFRQKYPEVFEQIKRGDRLRTLTVLKQAAILEPLVGNALLSYALRKTHRAEEGLEACRKSLELEPNQSDVLNHRFSFYFELKKDEDALKTAFDHLRRFPQESVSALNAIDGLLLNNQPLQAVVYAHRYFIICENIQAGLKQLFKAYEAAGLWQELADIFRELVPLIDGPTANTLFYYGEVLTEVGLTEESGRVFTRALELEPSNSKVILGYARSLARSGEEEQAKALLQTALADKTRIDKTQDRALLVTLLAEINRHSGFPERAVELFRKELPPDPARLASTIGVQPGVEFCQSLLAAGEKREALEAANCLLLECPNDSLVLELVKMVHHRTGRK